MKLKTLLNHILQCSWDADKRQQKPHLCTLPACHAPGKTFRFATAAALAAHQRLSHAHSK